MISLLKSIYKSLGFQNEIKTSDNFLSALLYEYGHLNSPFSLILVLSTLLEGLSGETQQQLANVFGISVSQIGSFTNELNKIYGELIKSGSVNISNVMLSRSDILLKKQYFESIAPFVNHEYFSTNDYHKIVEKVNGIVRQNTQGMINGILYAEEIDPNTFFIILNTIYFSSDWYTKFDEYDTISSSFYGSISAEKGVRQEQLMRMYEKRFKYYEREENQILIIPYQNRAFSFCIILPKDRNSLPPAHNILDKTSTIIGKAFDRGEFQYVDLTLPKFTQEIVMDINPLLQCIGVTKLFDNTMQANGMTDIDVPMAISLIRQKVKIEVNETGIVSNSATAMVCRLESCYMRGSVKPIDFLANHPFAYYIVHNESRSVLFSGIYN